MKRFKSYDEVATAVDQIRELDTAAGAENVHPLAAAALSEKAAALRASFAVKSRAAKAPKDPNAPASAKKGGKR